MVDGEFHKILVPEFKCGDKCLIQKVKVKVKTSYKKVGRPRIAKVTDKIKPALFFGSKDILYKDDVLVQKIEVIEDNEIEIIKEEKEKNENGTMENCGD